jgi:hypothetical protein
MWNGKSHPAFATRVAKLSELLKKYPETGQTLEARFTKNTVDAEKQQEEEERRTPAGSSRGNEEAPRHGAGLLHS